MTTAMKTTFTLFVTMMIADTESEQTFLDAMIPYAKWVNENEPNTTAYVGERAKRQVLLLRLVAPLLALLGHSACHFVLTSNSLLNNNRYQLMKSDKEGKELVYSVLERYRDKERDFVQTHRNSPQFLEFRSILKELQDDGKVVVSGESYTDT